MIYALIAALVIIAVDTALKYIQQQESLFSGTSSFYEQQSQYDTLKIPNPNIPSLAIAEGSSPSFIFEGVFPLHPDTAYVYRIERPIEKLKTVENAEATATTLGFVPGDKYTKVSKEQLKWENLRKTRALTFNKVDQIWRMRTQYFSDAQAIQPKTLLPETNQYVSRAKSLANNLGFTDTGLQSGKVGVVPVKLGNDGLFSQPSNVNHANYVSLNIFRSLPLARLRPKSQQPTLPQGTSAPPEFDGYVYTSNPRQGSLRMIVSDEANVPSADIYELDFVNYEYNYNHLVREIRSPEEAWDQVRLGNGSLRLLKLQTADYFANSQVLNVKKFALEAPRTELGFWEPDDWEGFVYPIYIFRGRAELTDGKTADFVFYMDAIKHFE